MDEARVLEVILPEAAGLAAFEALVELDPGSEPELRLAALLPKDPTVARRTAEGLRLSNAQRDRLVAAAGEPPPAGAESIRAAVYRDGSQAVVDRLKLAWARDPAAAEAWRSALAAADWQAPRFPLTGDDAMACGLARGPAVGAALRTVETAWIAGDFAEDRPALLRRLKEACGS
jgi:poly(A) polymerase